MKKLRLFVLLLFAAASFSACCDDYDDSLLKKQIAEITDQVKALEVLTSALENRDYITSVTPTTIQGVSAYVITFVKSPSITILNGKDGAPGTAGSSPITAVDTSHEDYVVFTLSDGKTITLPRNSELFVGFDNYDTFYCAPAANELTLLLPAKMKAADYTSLVATIVGSEGTSSDIQIRGVDDEGRWGVQVTKPTFAADGTVVVGSARVKIIIPQNVTYYKALLKVTLVDKKGQEHSATRPVWYTTGNVVVNVEGGLSAGVSQPATTTSLTVTGGMNAADFTYIKDNMPALEVLDLSRTTITTIPSGALAFYNNPGNGWNYTTNRKLKTVILPETLTTIENSAFAMCANLQEVNIPASVRTLGRWMFEGCELLRQVKLPEGITEIPPSAFYGSGLEAIRIPSTVTAVGGWAFQGCNNLRSITIPSSVTTLGESVLRECASLESAEVLANVEVLKGEFFMASSNLRSVRLSTSINTLSNNSFCNTGLTEYAIPTHITIIKEGAFCENTKLHTVTLPAGVQTSWSVFYDCPKLKNVTIAEGVTELGAEMFRGCVALEQIVLPSTITKIRDRAFQGCSALVSLTCKAAVAPELAVHNTGEQYNLHFFSINPSCVLKVPVGADYSAWNSSFGGGIGTIQ